jgi:hypothetical protein
MKRLHLVYVYLAAAMIIVAADISETWTTSGTGTVQWDRALVRYLLLLALGVRPAVPPRARRCRRRGTARRRRRELMERRRKRRRSPVARDPVDVPKEGVDVNRPAPPPQNHDRPEGPLKPPSLW